MSILQRLVDYIMRPRRKHSPDGHVLFKAQANWMIRDDRKFLETYLERPISNRRNATHNFFSSALLLLHGDGHEDFASRYLQAAIETGNQFLEDPRV